MKKPIRCEFHIGLARWLLSALSSSYPFVSFFYPSFFITFAFSVSVISHSVYTVYEVSGVIASEYWICCHSFSSFLCDIINCYIYYTTFYINRQFSILLVQVFLSYTILFKGSYYLNFLSFLFLKYIVKNIKLLFSNLTNLL